jgi:hypothetical protein
MSNFEAGKEEYVNENLDVKFGCENMMYRRVLRNSLGCVKQKTKPLKAGGKHFQLDP